MAGHVVELVSEEGRPLASNGSEQFVERLRKELNSLLGQRSRHCID